MKRTLVIAPLLAISCAQILSYDGYTAKPVSDATAGSDTASEVAAVDAADADQTGPTYPPPRPLGERKPSGKGKTLWLGVKRYHIGEQNPDGVYASDAFRHWGFDLDHVCTSRKDSEENIGTCRRHPDARQDVLTDGDRCRDNNFGQHLVPLVHAYSPDFELRLNEGIRLGNNTWVIRIDDLDPGEDDAYAPGKLYRTTSERKALTVKWDGSDVRTIVSDSVIDRDLDKPVNDFVGGYVKGNVWVAGDPTRMPIVAPVTGDVSVTLVLDGMLFSIELDPSHTNATHGTVGGGIPYDTFDSFVRPVASQAGFCPGSPLYDGLVKTVQKMPDLVAGAPNLQDINKPCDALSIGIGLELFAVQPSTAIADPLPPPKGKCDDAGVATDGG